MTSNLWPIYLSVSPTPQGEDNGVGINCLVALQREAWRNEIEGMGQALLEPEPKLSEKKEGIRDQ